MLKQRAPQLILCRGYDYIPGEQFLSLRSGVEAMSQGLILCGYMKLN